MDIRRGLKEYPLASLSTEIIYSQISYYSESKMSRGCKDLTRPTPMIYILRSQN